MPNRHADAEWTGTIKRGAGAMRLGSGAYEGGYTFKSRFEDDETAQTNPEELIAAAQASCYAMSLAKRLEDAGHKPRRIEATAAVRFDTGEGSTRMGRLDLKVTAEATDLDDDEAFQRLAAEAKDACPVSQALAGIKIQLDATLQTTQQGSKT